MVENLPGSQQPLFVAVADGQDQGGGIGASAQRRGMARDMDQVRGCRLVQEAPRGGLGAEQKNRARAQEALRILGLLLREAEERKAQEPGVRRLRVADDER